MTDEKRKRGRPLGSKNQIGTKAWRDALSLAVMRKDPKSGHEYLHLIAARVVLEAMRGNMAAVHEIGDRLDGRTVTIAGDPDNPMTLVTRIERVLVDVKDGKVIDLASRRVKEDADEPRKGNGTTH